MKMLVSSKSKYSYAVILSLVGALLFGACGLFGLGENDVSESDQLGANLPLQIVVDSGVSVSPEQLESLLSAEFFDKQVVLVVPSHDDTVWIGEIEEEPIIYVPVEEVLRSNLPPTFFEEGGLAGAQYDLIQSLLAKRTEENQFPIIDTAELRRERMIDSILEIVPDLSEDNLMIVLQDLQDYAGTESFLAVISRQQEISDSQQARLIGVVEALINADIERARIDNEEAKIFVDGIVAVNTGDEIGQVAGSAVQMGPFFLGFAGLVLLIITIRLGKRSPA